MWTLRSSLVLVVALLGCGDDATSGGGGEGAGGTNAGGSDSNGGAPAQGGGAIGGEGAGAGGSGGAPPCTAETLAEAVRTTSTAISGAASAKAITAESGDGSVVAWAGSDGNVHVTRLDAEDQRAGDDLLTAGSEVFGVAASDDGVALLVSRPPDYMAFVLLDDTGAEVVTTNLVGGGDHDVEGTEWFGEFARTGRLVRRADGSYAAYHALHRHWPDGVGHQGDTLRLLTAAGAPAGGGLGLGMQPQHGSTPRRRAERPRPDMHRGLLSGQGHLLQSRCGRDNTGSRRRLRGRLLDPAGRARRERVGFFPRVPGRQWRRTPRIVRAEW
ncbi:MAG: hypothetical protein HOW73_02015 [Polyangiaceae bacterium]|nr:hypothetical protein [Polyangiaceae bacterium]